jgi:hypothetical protein
MVHAVSPIAAGPGRLEVLIDAMIAREYIARRRRATAAKWMARCSLKGNWVALVVSNDKSCPGFPQLRFRSEGPDYWGCSSFDRIEAVLEAPSHEDDSLGCGD